MRQAMQSGGDPDTRMHYLSPYADVDVAAGAATAFVEATQDAGKFDKVILPLGGGGLAAGVGAWCSIRSPETKVYCSHPEIFGRTFSPNSRTSQQLDLPTPPSYADGLAVQLIDKTPFANLLDTTIEEVYQVSEAEIVSVIGAALRMQSLLIEGAAATTIAALLAENSSPTIQHGRILLLLTGGMYLQALLRTNLNGIGSSILQLKVRMLSITPDTDLLICALWS